MILVDTSIWVDHLRNGNEVLAAALLQGSALTHPFVIGELSLGHLSNRAEILALLEALPRVVPAASSEVTTLINSHRLFGRGIGYVDVALLASCLLTPEATLWTQDRRLAAVAGELGIAARLPESR